MRSRPGVEQPATPLTGAAPSEPWRWRLGVLVAYTLLGVIFTWPMVLHIGAGAIQIGTVPVDAGQGVWNLWWAWASLLQGANPLVTGHLFYPATINLFYQTLSLPNALSVWPVLAIFGPVAAFNTVVLLSFTLGGYWSYELARSAGAGQGGALLAGFVYAFTPYHLQRVWGGSLELVATHWLALYMLLLTRALARRSVASALLAGAALFVATLASQYHGLYAAVFTAAQTTLAAALAPRGARLRTLLTGAGVGVVWVALLLPIVLVAGGLGSVALEDWAMRQGFHSIALVDLLAPNIRHPLWGEAAAAWQRGIHPFGLESGAGMGLGVALLGVLALWLRLRAAWPWAAMALFCVLMAMGPWLRLTAAESVVPGPFLLLDLIEVFRNSSRPAIFVAHLMTPVAVLTALGFDGLARPAATTRRPRPAALRPAALALAALVFVESLVLPWPIMSLRAAPGASAMGADGTPGAVLALPPRLNDSRDLLTQICHGRPLMGGYLARVPFYPPASFPSATRGLWRAEALADDIIPLNGAVELANLGVRFVNLDLSELTRREQRNLATWLETPGIMQVWRGDERALYAVDPAVAAPSAVLGDGWYELEQEGGRRWRWTDGQAGLGLLAREPAVVELTLRATAFGGSRPLEVWQGEQLLTRVEVPGPPRDRTLKLRLLLGPGAANLVLVSPATVSPDGRRLSLSVEAVSLARLPVDPSWSGERSLAIPAGAPTPTGAPCG